MRKMFSLAVAALMATMNVNAQNNGYDTRHEIGISYGAGCNSDIITSFGGALGKALVGAQSDNDSRFGTIAVEYFYHTSKVIGVGAIAGFGQNKEDTRSKNTGELWGSNTDTYYTIMPAVKFNWLRKSHFGMYSKLAAGIMFSRFRYERTDGKENTDNSTDFNWQVSLIGVEAGSATLRGFAELGSGEQGIILAGVRYKF